MATATTTAPTIQDQLNSAKAAALSIQSQIQAIGNAGSSSTTPTTPSTGNSSGKQVYTVNGQKISATSQADASQFAASGGTGKNTQPGTGQDTGATSTSATPTPPTTPTTPVDTSQPSPTTVAVTPASQGVSGGVSDAQAQANLAAGGLKGADLVAAQNDLTAFQKAHSNAQLSGLPVPQDPGTGMGVASGATTNATDQTYVPPPQVQTAVSEATQKYTDDYAKYMSSASQGETLVQQYQDISNQLGIPALNTQLMSMKNIIDGTEDDIRNEVTKAGGFATDSQVLAMTNARNKVMIQNYNNLLQTKSDAMTQLTTLTGLAAQDRTFAAAQIDKQLNYDQQMITFATTAQTNAQDSIQKSIDNYGAASVYKQALATGDPNAVARINATMGNGFDLATAATAPPTLDDQVKLAQIAASKASTAKSYSDIAVNDQQNTLNSIAPYVNQTASGIKYIDASTLQGTAAQKNAIVNTAQAAGYKVITNKNEAADLTNIQNAYSNLNTIQSTFADLTSPSVASRTLNNLGLNQAAVALQTDSQKAASTALNDSALDLLKAISGTQGFRGNQAAIAQIKENLPTIYDTTAVANQKISYVQQLIQNREDAIVGNGNTTQSTNAPANTPAPQPLLEASQIPSGYYQASDGLLYKK